MLDSSFIKMLELANLEANNEEEMEDYFQDITPAEAIDRFRFVLNYFDIDYEEISIISKGADLLNYDYTFFELALNVLEQVDINKFRIDIMNIDVEKNRLIIGFKEPIMELKKIKI